MELRNELTRANECVEETAENQENLRVLVSEKQDMIGMLQDQVSWSTNVLGEFKDELKMTKLNSIVIQSVKNNSEKFIRN